MIVSVMIIYDDKYDGNIGDNINGEKFIVAIMVMTLVIIHSDNINYGWNCMITIVAITLVMTYDDNINDGNLWWQL